MSPHLSSSQSGYPSRSMAAPAASVRFGADWVRPLLASLPAELLTYTTRESGAGVSVVQPSCPTGRPGNWSVPTRLVTDPDPPEEPPGHVPLPPPGAVVPPLLIPTLTQAVKGETP